MPVDPLFSLWSEPFCQALARDRAGPGQRNPSFVKPPVWREGGLKDSIAWGDD